MWRWTKRIVAGLLVLLVVAAIGGATYQWMATRRDLAANPPPGKLVDVGGHRLHLWCTGSGAPTVILEPGFGDTALDWNRVQPEVATFTQVCSYDRAGMGYSDPGPTPRTSSRMVRELRTLLDRNGIEGRVVLVGASAGALTMRLLASEHPERVSGLVLVDGSHEDQGRRFAEAGAPMDSPWFLSLVPVIASVGVPRLAGLAMGLRPASLPAPLRGFAQAGRFRTSAYRTMVDEVTSASESVREVRAARRELAIPLVVVSAGLRAQQRGQSAEAVARLAALWRELQEDQAALSKQSCHVVAERSHHRIAREQPEIVVEAIRATVAIVKGTTTTLVCNPLG